MPWIHIIAAGSRLQTLIKQRVSFQVGRVEYLSLRPCSFLEYLGAMGENALEQMIRDVDVPSLYHKMMLDVEKYC